MKLHKSGRDPKTDYQSLLKNTKQGPSFRCSLYDRNWQIRALNYTHPNASFKR